MDNTVHDIKSTLCDLGLTLKSTFIPFSQSRNKVERIPSLNWRVTVERNGREVLTTDYSAGMGHCPSYKQGARQTLDYMSAINHECETGKTARRKWSGSSTIFSGADIAPKTEDVFYSLVMDSDVMDAGGFEYWAANYGFDADSRKAEATYRACLDIALKLRAAIGDEGLSRLREAFQDY